MSEENMGKYGSFEEFLDAFSFKDSAEVYSNGVMMIPVFRVKQWMQHMEKQQGKNMKQVSHLMDPNDCKNGFAPFGDKIQIDDGVQMDDELMDALKQEFGTMLIEVCRDRIHYSVEEVDGKKYLKGYLYVEG